MAWACMERSTDGRDSTVGGGRVDRPVFVVAVRGAAGEEGRDRRVVAVDGRGGMHVHLPLRGPLARDDWVPPLLRCLPRAAGAVPGHVLFTGMGDRRAAGAPGQPGVAVQLAFVLVRAGVEG